MGFRSKLIKQIPQDEMYSDDEVEFHDKMPTVAMDDYQGDDNGAFENDQDASDGYDNWNEDDIQHESMDEVKNHGSKDIEMEELEKEYRDLRSMEQNLIQNLKHNKNEDVLKGKAVKSQKALWDKTLEFRFLLQKTFSNSNRLPQEPLRSSFCELNEGVGNAYADVFASSKKAIDSLIALQEALLENNPSITQDVEGNFGSYVNPSGTNMDMNLEGEDEWLQISKIQSRITTFRNKSVDKWQRKTEVNTGAAAKKAKLLAFNQNISEQVATYMRDPNKMIKSMQMRGDTVGVFGKVTEHACSTKEQVNAEGDPELLDDSEFYQQLLKEFFETVDPTSSETAFYALKKLQTKKRKIVDRRASKSRKIRYHVHEKIINFMAPQPVNIPPMAPKLFENLFGLRSQNSVSAA